MEKKVLNLYFLMAVPKKRRSKFLVKQNKYNILQKKIKLLNLQLKFHSKVLVSKTVIL